MRPFRLAFPIFFLALICIGASAQMPSPTATPATDDADKRAKLDGLIQQALDDAITNAGALRLPENRAIAYAMLGDMYWRFDQKRARDLFRNVSPELSAFNADLEKSSPDARAIGIGFDVGLLMQDQRYQVIPLIAKHDAELARQVMLQTRRSSISQAIASGAPPAGPLSGTSIFKARELELEQQIAMYAADQDPEAAIKAIRDSLAQGISFSILPLLQKLEKFDEKKAADLGNDVVQKMLDTDMVRNTDMIRTAITFLQYSPSVQPSKEKQVKQFALTETQQKDIANKLAATLLALPPSLSSNSWFSAATPLVDKFAPDKSAAIKQRLAEVQRGMPADLRSMQQRQEMFSPNMTAEQIVAAIPKMPEESRTVAYAALMNKIGSIPDEAQAKRLIDQISDEKVRDGLEAQLDGVRADHAIQAGKLDDARKQIAQIADHKQQISRYVNLAIAYSKSGKDTDIEISRAVMRDAKALTAALPESGADLADLMELVRGYVVVDHDDAFKTAEVAIDMLNEYSEAEAVLSRYTDDRIYRNGEIIFRTDGYSGSLVFRYLPQVQSLGKADIERANQLLDRISRADVRLILRLHILQGVTAASTANAERDRQ